MTDLPIETLNTMIKWTADQRDHYDRQVKDYYEVLLQHDAKFIRTFKIHIDKQRESYA